MSGLTGTSRSEAAIAQRRAAQRLAVAAWRIQWWPEMDAVLDTAPRPVNAKAAAERIGVAPGSVRRRCRARGIPTLPHGYSIGLYKAHQSRPITPEMSAFLLGLPRPVNVHRAAIELEISERRTKRLCATLGIPTRMRGGSRREERQGKAASQSRILSVLGGLTA